MINPKIPLKINQHNANIVPITKPRLNNLNKEVRELAKDKRRNTVSYLDLINESKLVKMTNFDSLKAT